MSLPQPVRILLADDDPDDRRLIQEALTAIHFASHLNVVEDGEELMAYLKHTGKYAENSPAPNLILLDVNMPRMNGWEALRLIKSDVQLRHIPVVVLAAAGEPDQVAQTYQLGGTSFIAKPQSFEALSDVLRVAAQYWFGTVSLPSPRRA